MLDATPCLLATRKSTSRSSCSTRRSRRTGARAVRSGRRRGGLRIRRLVLARRSAGRLRLLRPDAGNRWHVTICTGSRCIPRFRARAADAARSTKSSGGSATRGARMLVVETSSRPDYEDHAAFYARRGYAEAARIRDFYAPATTGSCFDAHVLHHTTSAEQHAMSDWQKILRDESVDTLDEARRRTVRRRDRRVDVEALQPAFDNFQMRHHAERRSRTIKEVGDPMWNQYVPTVAGARHRRRRDRLARRGRRLAGAEHHAPLSRSRALPREPGLRELLPLLHAAPEGRRSGEDPAQPVRVGVRVHRGASRDPRRHPVGRRPDDAVATAGWSTSSSGCARSRTSRSSGSAAGSRRTCRSASRPSSARWCRSTIPST